jgi:hypothetical protein
VQDPSLLQQPKHRRTACMTCAGVSNKVLTILKNVTHLDSTCCCRGTVALGHLARDRLASKHVVSRKHCSTV